MQTDSSANLTGIESRSASEKTWTDWMESSLQALNIRSAISPRLAIHHYSSSERGSILKRT
jgi:hypothetical protein